MNEVALPPISDPSIPLDPSLPPSSTLLQTFGEYLSQIDVTYDGLHYAFIKLDASKKEIQNIDALQQYLHLRIIDISENQINSLSPGLDVQNHLMYLNASKNKLTRLEHITFATKLGLKVLDLSNNELEEICQLTTWPSLLTLNLNKNKLTQLSIEDAPHLNQLEVRGNQLNTLHLLQLPKLDKLYLGGNQLTDLQFLRNKPSLTLLHLRDNKLRSLPINLDENLSLIYLNLRNNQIESFSELEKLKSFIHLSKLVLLENPCCEQPNYRSNVIYRLPQLKTLDKESIRDEEREEAEKLRLEIERMEQERCRKEKEDAEALRKQQEKEETPVEEASEASKQDEINQNAETQEQGEKEEEKEEKEEEEEEEDDNDDLEDEV